MSKRISLLNDVSQYQPISLNELLYVNVSLPLATNDIPRGVVDKRYAL